MPLYKVTFETELLVFAESATQAEADVVNQEYDWSNEIGFGEATATAVQCDHDLKGYRGCIPYGLPKGDDRYCEQVLAAST